MSKIKAATLEQRQAMREANYREMVAARFPCLNSNNSIGGLKVAPIVPPRAVARREEKEKEFNEFSNSHRKSAYALEQNVRGFIEHFGIEHVGFLTLTFADHVTDSKEAQRRFNSLRTNYLKKHYSNYIRVWASHDGRDIQREVREAAAKKARDAAAAAEAAEAARREAYENINNTKWVEAILNKKLDALLNSQQANADAITVLLNAMWGSGLINTGNTQTNVTGGDSANTFTTAPYTPADGQTAQQTQFIVNNNGNVITNIVSRPDLAPHSSQAPTRQPIGGQSQTNTQSPNNPGTAQPAPNPGQSEGQKPDICKSSPNNIACADLGNTDYTDPELPQETRNLSFNPADIFASNSKPTAIGDLTFTF